MLRVRRGCDLRTHNQLWNAFTTSVQKDMKVSDTGNDDSLVFTPTSTSAVAFRRSAVPASRTSRDPHISVSPAADLKMLSGRNCDALDTNKHCMAAF
jgi:hypothetical protein